MSIDRGSKWKRQTLSGWGNSRRESCWWARPESEAEVQHFLERAPTRTWIARGLGRSYGDSSIDADGSVLDMTLQNNVHRLDAKEGCIETDAGISLGQIIGLILPAGWFLPVTPGSQWVTLGGAIAADVHGKNHHADGSFGSFIDELVLETPTGGELVCRRDQNSEAFHATIGGMGLTGLIRRAHLRLLRVTSASVRVQIRRTASLDETLETILALSPEHRYAVAWIDCLARGSALGRGVLLLGDHLAASELEPSKAGAPFERAQRRKLSVPFTPPGILLNSWTCRAFNERFYQRNPSGERIMELDSFFYPLDNVSHWNRLYGPRGFIEYQAVFPFDSARRGAHQLFQLSAKHGFAPFFAGLKTFGRASGGILSFPMPGITVAFDVPVRRGLKELTNELDRTVIELGGRVYLAKDATLTPASFSAMYPQLDQFRSARGRLDPREVLSSTQARRLGLALA